MSGKLKVVQRTVTREDWIIRPANTTQYTAGDTLSDTVTRTLWFPNVVLSPGGGGIIQSATVIDSTAETTKPDIEMYLFNAAIVSQADNAAWAPTDTEMRAFVGMIALPSTSFKTCGANGIIQSTDKSLAFNCALGSRDLWVVPVMRNTYTPVSAEQFTFKIVVLPD